MLLLCIFKLNNSSFILLEAKFCKGEEPHPFKYDKD